jgi:cell division cycle 2-like protein
MAAGRVDVLRKRDFGGYSRRDSDHHHQNNRSRCGVESYQVPDHASHTDVFRLSSSKRHDLDSESAESYRGKDKVYDVAQVKNGKVLKHTDVHGVQAPPEKKRKFSPITWDMGDKGARSTSKSRDLPAITAQTSTPQLEVTKPHEFTSQLKQLEASSVKMVETALSKSSSLLVEEFHGGDDEEQGEVKGEEFGRSRNIESSRWASDSGSSPSDILSSGDEETPKKGRSRSSSSSRTIGDTRSSTPESGEICRDGSGTDFTRLSVERVATRDDECSEDELLDGDLMDTDKFDNQSPVGGRVESEVEELVVPSHRNFNMLNSCRSVSEFEKLNKISEGSYGIVYRARDKKTDEIVALKKVKIKVDRDYLEYGFPLSALREINILLSFDHPSIVDVKEVVMGSDLDSVFMVMEYIENDLKGLMDKMKKKKLIRFSTSEVKCLMKQLLEGVKYLHDNWVLHRDLKTANLLFNNNGQMKICDFGISRQ